MKIAYPKYQSLFVTIALVICSTGFLVGQSIEPMLNTGNQYLKEKEYLLALDQFDLALDLEANNLQALLGKANAHLGLKEHNKAIDDLLLAINNNDHAPEAFLALGKIHFNFGNYEAAQEAFSAGVAESPQDVHLNYFLGASSFKLGQMDYAEPYFVKAELYGDSSAYLNYYLSELNLRKDSLEIAGEYIERAILKNPNIPRFYLTKGDLAFMQKDFLWASLHYSTALRLNPDYIDAREARAKAYLADEKHMLALSDLRTITEYDPSLAQAWVDRANCEFVLELYQKAVNSYTTAIDLELNYAWVSKRALAYQSMDDFKSAISDLRFLVIQFPNDGKLRFRLGNLYQLDSQYDKALQEYEACIELDRNNVLAWNNKAVVLYYLGKNEHACHIWEEIINKSFDDDYKEMAKQNIISFCKQE